MMLRRRANRSLVGRGGQSIGSYLASCGAGDGTPSANAGTGCLLHMVRMLQALKNLEARSPAKPAPKPNPAPPPNVIERLAATSVLPSIPPPVSVPSAPAVTESIDALAVHLASLEIAIKDPPGRF